MTTGLIHINQALTVAAAPAWTPADLTGLKGWWDASDTGSITSSGSPAKVSQWNDLSASGYHMTQATGSAQPTTGAVTINGLNVLSGWGSGIWMVYDGSNILTGVNTSSWMAVFKPSSTSVQANGRVFSMNPHFADDYNNGAAIAAIVRNGSAAEWGMFYSSAQRGTEALSNDAVHAILNTRNGDTGTTYVDDSAGTATTGLGTTNFTIDSVHIGSYNHSGGAAPLEALANVCEIVWTSGVLSSGDRASWFSYCQAKWGTP